MTRTQQGMVIGFILFLFLFLSFFQLNAQEFLGDEASPILLVDRMWDAFSKNDARYLGYPFLFYHDPFRALFSGTITHIIGPDRVFVRLPSILWGIATLSLVLHIVRRWKLSFVSSALLTLSYVLSAITMNGRLAGGDAQARFLMVLATYCLVEAATNKRQTLFLAGLGAFIGGLLTMLNTLALTPLLLWTFWTQGFWRQRIPRGVFFGVLTILLGYFFLWAYLPLRAYQSGYQEHYLNRGLWYYTTRVAEGHSSDPGKSIRALSTYSSLPFSLWAGLCVVLLLGIKRRRALILAIYPCLLAVMLLNRSSFHILMYAGVFLVGMLVVTSTLEARYPRFRPLLYGWLVLLCLSTAWQTYHHFLVATLPHSQEFMVGRVYSTEHRTTLDESVLRIYSDHGKLPLER